MRMIFFHLNRWSKRSGFSWVFLEFYVSDTARALRFAPLVAPSRTAQHISRTSAATICWRPLFSYPSSHFSASSSSFFPSFCRCARKCNDTFFRVLHSFSKIVILRREKYCVLLLYRELFGLPMLSYEGFFSDIL